MKSLLETCRYTIPSYDEVTRTTRAVTRKIIDPLENALDTLANENIIKWEYSNAKKEPLTDQQIKAFDYETFSRSYIKFELIDAKYRNSKKLNPAPKSKPRAKKKAKEAAGQ